jgi:cyanophycin synthetase
MSKLCNGEVIYFSLDPELPAVTAHRAQEAQGRRAVIVRDGEIMLATGPDEVPLIKLTNVPLTDGGRAVAQVENVLAAVAAAWALGIAPGLIRSGIETTESSQEKCNPLRIERETQGNYS